MMSVKDRANSPYWQNPKIRAHSIKSAAALRKRRANDPLWKKLRKLESKISNHRAQVERHKERIAAIELKLLGECSALIKMRNKWKAQQQSTLKS